MRSRIRVGRKKAFAVRLTSVSIKGISTPVGKPVLLLPFSASPLDA